MLVEMQMQVCRVLVMMVSSKVRLVPKFKEYDRDGNGYISLEEASMILQNKPFNFPADKVVVLLRKFDKDGNGKLDIDEFADFYAEAKATSVLSHRRIQGEGPGGPNSPFSRDTRSKVWATLVLSRSINQFVTRRMTNEEEAQMRAR